MKVLPYKYKHNNTIVLLITLKRQKLRKLQFVLKKYEVFITELQHKR